MTTTNICSLYEVEVLTMAFHSQAIKKNYNTKTVYVPDAMTLSTVCPV